MDFLLTPDPGLVFWTTLTFGILVFVLKRFAWGPILHALRVREETIEYSLKAADKAKSEVEDLVKLREELIDSAKTDRDDIMKEARELKEKIINEARNSAQKEANKLIDLARKQIEAEKLSAIRELKKQVAELSVDIAGIILESELQSDQKQKELIDKYLDNVNFN
ncbi:F0F1 ATP synthase subunit B [Plebeiibacterium marinum]|uniref:ATP synthase subunit b n=1 Tax=Plebeiibacterium marinum TaxID=2992111 RepID=A0AAE3SKH5_9BACT|nr:F0F1 ATP synthase subunit B [Plebeiobacterium marinum]MCW3806439.1 F0F1 ATP synthase subunit B [Plebeiobacterium marinum]